MDIRRTAERNLREAATAWGIEPHFAEKDYALGWLLWGISRHRTLSEHLIFKGGTCIKKCFHELHRLSEDLDFTLAGESILAPGPLSKAFAEIGERIQDRAALTFPEGSRKFKLHRKPRGRLFCRAHIGYLGPLSSRGRAAQRIKVDLTADERMVLAPVAARVHHPCFDAPKEGITVRSYGFAEAFGEKIVALAERAMPRDLYDVTNLFRSAEPRPDRSVLRDVIAQKCAYRNMAFPTLAHVEKSRDDFERKWSAMLRRQMPDAPPMEPFWSALPGLFRWLEGAAAAAAPPALAKSGAEEIVSARTWRLPMSGRKRFHLNSVRFAASNHLCVDLLYQDAVRRIEPYSLRRTEAGPLFCMHTTLAQRDAAATGRTAFRARR